MLLTGCGAAPKSWVVYYGAEPAGAQLAPYDIIVVDGGYTGPLGELKARGAMVLAYLSLAEVSKQRAHFAQAQQAGLLVKENPNWPGAWMLEVRDERWRAMVVEQLAPALLARGFDGLFLDTVDSALHLEATEPKTYGGASDAAVDLILRLHRSAPRAKLMLNGAVPLLARLRGAVDMVAVESSMTDWDFARKTARWRRPDERKWATDRLAKARLANGDLRVFTLDYWPVDDAAGRARIYREQRAAGFVPYVATIALDRVIAEPTPQR